MSQLPISTEIKGNSDKYKRIIHAAIKVFAQKGFFNAKVADVAKAADVADGTIYLYFKNKDDLLVSIFEHSMDYFISQAKSELSSLTNPEEKLKKFVELSLTNVKKLPNLAQVLLVELRVSTQFMKEYKPEKLFEYLSVVSDIIEEGQAAGVFNQNLSSHMIRRSILGAIDELVLEWILSKKKRFELDQASDHLMAFILGGLKGSC